MRVRKIDDVQTVKHAADIFMSHKGVHDAQRKVTIEEAEKYQPAETFERFLEINGIAIYEQEFRDVAT